MESPRTEASNLAPEGPRGLPDAVARRMAWVLGDDLRAPNGLLLSWLHTERPGYPYPEATAFGVRVLGDLHRRTGDDRHVAEAEPLVAALVDAADPRGGFGKNERLYAFDTAVALAAFLDWIDMRGAVGDERVRATAERAARFLRDMVELRLAAIDANETRPAPARPARWSLRFGPHLVKALPVLDRARRAGLDADLAEETWQVRAEIAEASYGDGRFHVDPDRATVYVHAHCYALEGLIAFAGARGPAPGCLAGAAWLAEVQRPDGSLPHWWRDGRLEGRAGDATAQAVRLWAVLDRARFAAPIERGLAFLASLETPGGGLRYAADHAEANSWTTLFAVQAELVARMGPAADPIA